MLCLVLLSTIAACLGCATLSADVTVMVAPKALFYPAGAVVKLTLVNFAVPYHSGIDDGVGHFWVFKLDHN